MGSIAASPAVGTLDMAQKEQRQASALGDGQRTSSNELRGGAALSPAVAGMQLYLSITRGSKRTSRNEMVGVAASSPAVGVLDMARNKVDAGVQTLSNVRALQLKERDDRGRHLVARRRGA